VERQIGWMCCEVEMDFLWRFLNKIEEIFKIKILQLLQGFNSSRVTLYSGMGSKKLFIQNFK